MATKKILFVVANEGFQPIEYGTPKKLLEQEGYTIVTASDKLSPAIAKDGSTTPVDVLVQDAKAEDYDGIFIIGGPGTLDHLDIKPVHQLLQACAQNEQLCGGICLGTRILARSGILKGKYATGWDGDKQLEAEYKKHHVHLDRGPVITDEYIITASGPEAAASFGSEIIRTLAQK